MNGRIRGPRRPGSRRPSATSGTDRRAIWRPGRRRLADVHGPEQTPGPKSEAGAGVGGFVNFIDVVRSRKREDQLAEIEEGAISTMLSTWRTSRTGSAARCISIRSPTPARGRGSHGDVHPGAIPAALHRAEHDRRKDGVEAGFETTSCEAALAGANVAGARPGPWRFPGALSHAHENVSVLPFPRFLPGSVASPGSRPTARSKKAGCRSSTEWTCRDGSRATAKRRSRTAGRSWTASTSTPRRAPTSSPSAEFYDFDLYAEVKPSETTNSGLYLRDSTRFKFSTASASR